MLQARKPVDKLEIYLDGFHFYNGHMQSQMEAHHYCSKLNEDVTQCVIFDGNGDGAKMMGFTKDGQLNKPLEQDRDRRFNLSTAEKKKNRADIPTHPVQPGADAWQTGDVVQLPALTEQEHH